MSFSLPEFVSPAVKLIYPWNVWPNSALRRTQNSSVQLAASLKGGHTIYVHEMNQQNFFLYSPDIRTWNNRDSVKNCVSPVFIWYAGITFARAMRSKWLSKDQTTNWPGKYNIFSMLALDAGLLHKRKLTLSAHMHPLAIKVTVRRE